MGKQYTLRQICQQYDQGWNAQFDGKSYESSPLISWRDGWIDSKWSKDQQSAGYVRLKEEQ
jgi:hypothetical protein